MKVQVKKLINAPEADIMFKAYEDAAGCDLFSAEEIRITGGQCKSVKTGICMAIQPGYRGIIKATSGFARRNNINITAGVIDADYTGEVEVVIQNLSHGPLDIHRNDKIAQILFEVNPKVEIEFVETLPETKRGKKGFGSTD